MLSSSVTVVGNVASDLRQRNTQEGIPLVNFSVASNERKFDRDSNRWSDGPATFYTVTCWRHVAENVVASIEKGDPVVVIGKLVSRHWEKEGKTGTSLEITADLVGHDLTRGVAKFQRSRRFTEPDVAALAA